MGRVPGCHRCHRHRGGLTGYNLRSGYTKESLESMTISEIKALAGELGYSITKTRKAEIIEEFLSQQEV